MDIPTKERAMSWLKKFEETCNREDADYLVVHTGEIAIAFPADLDITRLDTGEACVGNVIDGVEDGKIVFGREVQVGFAPNVIRAVEVV